MEKTYLVFEKLFNELEKQIISDLRKRVKNICDKYYFSFLSGMGTYIFSDKNGHTVNEYEPIKEIQLLIFYADRIQNLMRWQVSPLVWLGNYKDYKWS